MKNYFNTILIASILLLIFPFLSFPELWENIYVSVLAFTIGYSSMLIRHKVLSENENDDEASLQEYVQELKERFREHEKIGKNSDSLKRISDITVEDEK